MALKKSKVPGKVDENCSRWALIKNGECVNTIIADEVHINSIIDQYDDAIEFTFDDNDWPSEGHSYDDNAKEFERGDGKKLKRKAKNISFRQKHNK